MLKYPFSKNIKRKALIKLHWLTEKEFRESSFFKYFISFAFYMRALVAKFVSLLKRYKKYQLGDLLKKAIRPPNTILFQRVQTIIMKHFYGEIFFFDQR